MSIRYPRPSQHICSNDIATTSNAFKRIVILSDGSWNTLESDSPSNIIKIMLAIDHEDEYGIQQTVFYDPGVGTAGGLSDMVLGGAAGAGMDRNIQQLYTFLALNYDDGDEVYMFGFSRGAYTVRSLAGLIHEAGLVRRDQVQWVAEAYELYRDNERADSDHAIAFRKEHGDRIPIKLVACFDTVGTLGLPLHGFVQRYNERRYAFHDTVLGENVEHGIHMMSIDEERFAFAPTPMKPNKIVGDSQVSELYFWGGHGEVGGLFECGKATLDYLVEEMQRRGLQIKMDTNRLLRKYDFLDPPKPDTFGYTALRFVTGQEIRKIESVKQIHPSSILRYQQLPSWRPAALEPIRKDLLAFNISDNNI